MTLLATVSERIGRPVPRLRVVKANDKPATEPATRTARPEALDAFIGQSSVVFNLTVECMAAEMENRLPDHILLEGPAGLGKTSLARCIAERLGVRFVEIPGTALTKVDAAANAIARIGEPSDGPCIAFIDEVHDTCKKAQTLLLSALEDHWIQPAGAERLDLAPFCCIGATTNPGQLSRALRDRFTVREALDFYPVNEVELIVKRYAEHQRIALDDDAVHLIASVGRGTPRVANGLVRRVAAFGRVAGADIITGEMTAEALDRLGIDEHGLEPQDRKIMQALVGQTRAVGLETMSAMLNVDNDAITNREPFMLRVKVLSRTRGGRVLTRAGYRALGETAPVWVPA